MIRSEIFTLEHPRPSEKMRQKNAESPASVLPRSNSFIVKLFRLRNDKKNS